MQEATVRLAAANEFSVDAAGAKNGTKGFSLLPTLFGKTLIKHTRGR